jgi:glycosyltransferase involved in cell wall biosynthesis
MNVLVLAALTEATGNAVTAHRIADALATQHRVVLADSNDASARSLRELASAESIDVAIGVHALLAGPFLRALGVPYALIFGGTDLYEPMHELQQAQMARAATGAARLVAFSPENVARAEWMWPTTRGRVELVPQAVSAPLEGDAPSMRAELGLGDGDILAVLPTGIRRVKDPLHLVEAFSRWHETDPRVHLVIAGALLEPDYVERALPLFERLPGVRYLNALPRPRMLRAIDEADLVLNTSLSEGMCGVILEAQCLSTPVLARRNAGNESLVVHGHTGLLYDAPDEAVHWARALVGSPELRSRIAATAAKRIASVHSPEAERDAYLALVEDMADMGRPSALPPPAPPVDELRAVLETATRLGIRAPIHDALAALVSEIAGSPPLGHATKQLAGFLGTAPPSVAIAEIRAHQPERALGPDVAPTYYLLLALMQVPTAEARHAARGVDGDTIAATVRDLVEWAHHFDELDGTPGITLEILEWAQRYLRGELFRLGPLQFDLRPFDAPMHVWRHRETRGLSAFTLDRRPIDLVTGVASPTAGEVPGPDTHELALEPGTPMLQMWMPGAIALMTMKEVAEAIRRAFELFGRLSPETRPVGVYGESWRLDPQVREFMPHEPGVHDIQAACALYPSSLGEDKTIRRVYGPRVSRANLEGQPREGMNAVQLAMAEFLAWPNTELKARCGFVLGEELRSLPDWSA